MVRTCCRVWVPESSHSARDERLSFLSQHDPGGNESENRRNAAAIRSGQEGDAQGARAISSRLSAATARVGSCGDLVVLAAGPVVRRVILRADVSGASSTSADQGPSGGCPCRVSDGGRPRGGRDVTLS